MAATTKGQAARLKAETCPHWDLTEKPWRYYRAVGLWKRRVYCQRCTAWWTDEETIAPMEGPEPTYDNETL